MPLSPRRAIARDILIGWALSAGFIAAGYHLLAATHIFQPSTYGKAAAFSLTLSALPLMASIGYCAMARFSTPHIDGSDPIPGIALDLARRILQNTAEQTLLFAIASMAFFFAAPEFSARILPVMALWFVIARTMFGFGYVRAPLARAIGFAATFHPTIVLLLAALIMSLR